MVAGNDDHMSAAGVRSLAEEAVVQLLGAVARRRGIEDVPGHQQYIHALLPKGFGQPVEKGLELPITAPAVQGAAQMPVRCMQQPEAASRLHHIENP